MRRVSITLDHSRKIMRTMRKLFVPCDDAFNVKTSYCKHDDIDRYMACVLGPPTSGVPYPKWSSKKGADKVYLRRLLSWCTGRAISRSDVSHITAETIDNRKLYNLKLYPQLWPLPLNKSTIEAVQKRYTEADYETVETAIKKKMMAAKKKKKEHLPVPMLLEEGEVVKDEDAVLIEPQEEEKEEYLPVSMLKELGLLLEEGEEEMEKLWCNEALIEPQEEKEEEYLPVSMLKELGLLEEVDT